MKRNPTHSVRKGGLAELWLDDNGQWGPFENRKRFPTQDAADLAGMLITHDYGIFPNSKP